MGRVGWYARRLRSMSGREILWRAGRLRHRVTRRRVTWESARAGSFGREEPDWNVLLRRFRESADRPVLLDRARALRIAAEYPAEAEAVIAAAEQILAGKVRYFGYPPIDIGTDIDWNFDPLSGTHWPSAPSERIDHRTAAGDPKWIWELNRLQHLPWLAQAYLFTGEDRFAEKAFEHLDSWIEQNPPGLGIAWRGAFECGIRAISVAIAVQGLRDAPGLTPERFTKIVTLLGESARRCWAERSLFSSANNHLIGELAGLATVAILLPELPSAPRWERDALALLIQHGDRQILPDGAGAEQAVGYQLFTVELLAVVYALLTLRGQQPHEIGTVIGRSTRYLTMLVGKHDPAPRYGDDDGGFALRLGPEDIRTVREHLGIADAVLRPPTIVPATARTATATISAAWLRTALAASPAVTGMPPVALSRSAYAADGGMVVLRSGSRRVLMDVGPLGFLSIAAHGHADALAVNLAVDGEDLIGDPGTPSYYGHPEWRAACRSTRAHATVCVDDQDQSVIGGPFLWTAHAGVRVRAVDLARGVVDAEHDGYRRLADPVMHRRWLIAPPHANGVVVVDLLSGTESHAAQVSWPLHPSLEAEPVEGGQLVRRDGAAVLAVAYAATVPIEPNQLRGEEDSALGWWAELLESREPSWLIGARACGPGPFAVATVLTPLRDGVAPARDVRIEQCGNAIRVAWRTGEISRTLNIDAGGDGAVDLRILLSSRAE
ncbi:heparinase II/III family protein [Nocardia huaxiensis]|uniref:heparinase II/III family protein n=1 Tax=Nocardia huaxiensis TaxID=2755382 RepID=UPI001E44D625|nr:alginate lyase family protein [Nocardia huaxiensis]UFS98880.1 heparinase II/III family protein [Nocardia huaxiensis]